MICSRLLKIRYTCAIWILAATVVTYLFAIGSITHQKEFSVETPLLPPEVSVPPISQSDPPETSAPSVNSDDWNLPTIEVEELSGQCVLQQWNESNVKPNIAKFIHGPEFVSFSEKENIIRVNCIAGKTITNDSTVPASELQFQLLSLKTKNQWIRRNGLMYNTSESYYMFLCGKTINSWFRPPLYNPTVVKKVKARTDTVFEKQHQPLVRDVVFILLDAIHRGYFRQTFHRTVEYLNSLAIPSFASPFYNFEFSHYTVTGFHSPPNKTPLIVGQPELSFGNRYEVMFDFFGDAGFLVHHADGECGGFSNITDYSDHRPGSFTGIFLKAGGRLAQYDSWFPAPLACRPPSPAPATSSCSGRYAGYSFCSGHLPSYEQQLNFTRRFLHSYKGHKRFTSHTIIDTHYPSIEHPKLDEILEDFLRDLTDPSRGNPFQFSEDGVIILLSDHGMHYGQQILSFDGLLYHTQPLMHFITGKKLLNSMPEIHEALAINKDQLVTHYDTYSTLIELSGKKTLQTTPHGSSLLHPILGNRSCEDAGVPPQYCPCDWTSICPENVESVIEQAIAISNTIVADSKLSSYCRKLTKGFLRLCIKTRFTYFVLYGLEEYPSKWYRVDVKDPYPVQLSSYEKEWEYCNSLFDKPRQRWHRAAGHCYCRNHTMVD